MPQCRRNFARYKWVCVMLFVQIFAVAFIIVHLATQVEDYDDDVGVEEPASQDKSLRQWNRPHGSNFYINRFEYDDVEGEGNDYPKPDDNKVLGGNMSFQSDWQPVGGSTLSIYSAYHVSAPRQMRMIKIIGIDSSSATTRVRCRLYDAEFQSKYEVGAFIRPFTENSNIRYDYSAYFILCGVPRNKTFVPRFVSVIATEGIDPGLGVRSKNLLPIQYSKLTVDKRVDFAVCVRPIHNFRHRNEELIQFLEWTEFHRTLGVKKFTFYNNNNSIPKNLQCIIEKVYGKGVMTLLPWTIPGIEDQEIRNKGSAAALTDCVYRHKGVTEFLIMVYLDEIIVPRQEVPIKNYASLMKYVRNVKDFNRNVAGYGFQQGFYYQEWAFTIGQLRKKFNGLVEYSQYFLPNSQLMTFVNIRRSEYPKQFQSATTYICRPDLVLEADQQRIWLKDVLNYGWKFVNPGYAAVNHYHSCSKDGCVLYDEDRYTVEDTAAHSFLKQLVPRVKVARDDVKRLFCYYNDRNLLNISVFSDNTYV